MRTLVIIDQCTRGTNTCVFNPSASLLFKYCFSFLVVTSTYNISDIMIAYIYILPRVVLMRIFLPYTLNTDKVLPDSDCACVHLAQGIVGDLGKPGGREVVGRHLHEAFSQDLTLSQDGPPLPRCLRTAI